MCSESFLAFDLEQIFSAAFVLTMLTIVLPDAVRNRTYQDEVDLILDDLIFSVSAAASFQSSELDTLQSLVKLWQARTSPIPTNAPFE
jgi:proline utilization trans-activator